MSNRTITAVFDTAAEAESASRDLAMKVGGVRAAVFTSRSETTELKGLGVSGPDQSVLEEAIRRGNAVLSATVPEAYFNDAADVVEAAGAVDLDAREAEWRSTGWTDAGAMPAGGSDIRAPDTLATSGTTATPMGGTHATAAPSTSAPSMAAPSMAGTAGTQTTATGLAAGREESIPIVEEQLRIGKRETAHGRVRIRSYVVETPVQEQVSLHSEHVQVERRPVDRPIDAATAAFQDRTIEATETAEEAVVAKEARVKEEVVIRKTAEDQTQTVSDTVRRTEVEIDDDRNVAGRATTKTTTPRTDRNP